MTLLADVSGWCAGAGIVQCLLGFIAVIEFALRSRASALAPADRLPPVTVLKPLCGAEPLLAEAIESCFRQAYPNFQIVFGVQDQADPALDVVDRLRSRYPDRAVNVVIDSTMHGSNRKLSNLINMLPFAEHDILVISDSDLHVVPSYLHHLVTALLRPGTGLVTSLYFGRPPVADDWISALGASQISHNFLPGVLLSRALGRQDCLGSTAMFRRETLDRIGGLHPLVHVLAEDNVMGQRVRGLGLSVALAPVVPVATVPENSTGALWHHEMRWTRTIRGLAPIALSASTLQYPLFWSTLCVLFAAGAPWAFAVFLTSWAVRAGCALGIDRCLDRHLTPAAFAPPLWLLPVRDFLSVIEIVCSFWVDEVVWRGHKLAAGGAVTVPAHVGFGTDGQT